MIANEKDEIHSKDRTWFIRRTRGGWDVYAKGIKWNTLAAYRTREDARWVIRWLKQDRGVAS